MITILIETTAPKYLSIQSIGASIYSGDPEFLVYQINSGSLLTESLDSLITESEDLLVLE